MSQQIYQHYKGGRYIILCTALESTNNRERKPVVVYISLDKGEINVRDRVEFNEEIEWPSGIKRPRFCPIELLRGKP